VPADNTHFNTSNKTSANPLPSQDHFRQQLRQRVRHFIRYLLEATMQEEMTTFLQAEFGEQGNAARQGQRNGYYTRSLFTAMGKVEDLYVPRDRAGLFQTEVFERYNRSEPEVEEAVEAMYVAGVSQKKVAAVTEKLMGTRPAPKRVAKMTAGLAERFEEWRKATLQPHYRVIYLDGVYYPVVYEDKAGQGAVLVALEVDQGGHKEVLAIFAGAEESKVAWASLLSDPKARGMEQVDLFVTDGGDGLIAALKES
jgi:transposase-like protein